MGKGGVLVPPPPEEITWQEKALTHAEKRELFLVQMFELIQENHEKLYRPISPSWRREKSTKEWNQPLQDVNAIKCSFFWRSIGGRKRDRHARGGLVQQAAGGFGAAGQPEPHRGGRAQPRAVGRPGRRAGGVHRDRLYSNKPAAWSEGSQAAVLEHSFCNPH